MILETFTHQEIYTSLRKAYEILNDRAAAYLSHNFKKIHLLCKHGEYTRIFSGIIDNQRYTFKIVYGAIKNGNVAYGGNNLYTVFNYGNRKMLIKMYRYGSPDTHQYGIAYFTEHFMNRFCERLQLCEANLPLLDKARLFDENTDLRVHGSFDDNIINRYKSPSLKAPFLSKENLRIECECFKNGDIAIVEHYDKVTVWRTYVTKEMLYDSQLNDPAYVCSVEKSFADRDTPADHEWIPKVHRKA